MRLETRPYQQRIVRQAVEHFARDGLRSVLVDSPTGSGKTVMGLLAAGQLQRRLGVRVGWVAMRRNLLAQAAEENQRLHLGVECCFLSMFDKRPPADLDLLVVDEAQHDAAASMAHLHNVIRPRFILGLSATPFRGDAVRLCFDKVIRDAGIHALIQDGYLSPYEHYTIPTYTPQAVTECYLREPARWGKSIFYFHTLLQCEEARRLLTRRGVRAETVTGASDRQRQLDDFRAGRLDVLVNCVVLAEGFDCPELGTVFCRPSCKSATIQMCGRVFRKHPGVPVKRIVQCQQTRWPFPRTARPLLHYTWQQGGWRSLQANPRIHQVAARTLRAMARIDVKLPRIVEAAASGRARWPLREET